MRFAPTHAAGGEVGQLRVGQCLVQHRRTPSRLTKNRRPRRTKCERIEPSGSQRGRRLGILVRETPERGYGIGRAVLVEPRNVALGLGLRNRRGAAAQGGGQCEKEQPTSHHERTIHPPAGVSGWGFGGRHILNRVNLREPGELT